jgi:hypothetical protein
LVGLHLKKRANRVPLPPPLLLLLPLPLLPAKILPLQASTSHLSV